MENHGITITTVPRALEMKSKLFGFELPDLLLIFLNLSATNFLFGSTALRIPLVWGTTAVIASVLLFAKKGKPDSYLKHLGQYLFSPGYLTAGGPDTSYRKFSIKENSTNE